MKRTVAILGQNVEKKLEIALGLANDLYPVVLQVEIEQERKVKRKISKRRLNVAVTTYPNSFSCAWEADVIIIVGSDDKLAMLAKEIENYITGKIIIIILNEGALSAEIKSSFRYAKNFFMYNSDHIVDTKQALAFFNLTLSSEIRSLSAGDAGCNSGAAGMDNAAKLVKEIERLLDVFY